MPNALLEKQTKHEHIDYSLWRSQKTTRSVDTICNVTDIHIKSESLVNFNETNMSDLSTNFFYRNSHEPQSAPQYPSGHSHWISPVSSSSEHVPPFLQGLLQQAPETNLIRVKLYYTYPGDQYIVVFIHTGQVVFIYKCHNMDTHGDLQSLAFISRWSLAQG